MGGFLGIGGSSAKTDRDRTLTGYQNLNNIFGFAFPQAKKAIATGAGTTGAGLEGLSNAAAYFKRLATGTRPAVLQAVAPSINAANDQADASRRQQSEMGTARGGGQAGPNQQAETAKQAAIDNLIFGAGASGATGEAAVGKDIASVGAMETAQGNQLLNTGLSAEGTMTSDAIGSRTDSAAINKGAQQDVIGAALALFA